MVLLSSSTVGVAVSSTVVGFFTLVLFFSGYILQQQSVRSIQAALQQSASANPPVEPAYASDQAWEQTQTPELLVIDKTRPRVNIIGRRTSVRIGSEQLEMNDLVEGDGGDEDAPEKQKHAILHILTKPIAYDICSTFLFFEALESNSTQQTDRILLYPRSWDLSSPTKSVSLALALLKGASARLNAVVQGIDTSDIGTRSLSETQMIKKATVHLAEYERVLFLRSPGHLINIDKLEEMLSSNTAKTMQVGSSRMKSPAWIPTRLSITRRRLPPAVLVADENSASWPATNGKTAQPKPYVLNSETMQQMNFVMESSESPGRQPGPAYVYFDDDMVRRGNTDMHYTEWKQQVQLVCKGVGLGL